MASKFDLSRITKEIKNSKFNVGSGDNLKTLTDEDFLHMPKWWKEATNTKGLIFGGMVQIAGDSDSGKTSCAIQAMKAAQEQDCFIIYVETENKTTTKDLTSWGVDASQVMVIKESIAEDAYDALYEQWDAFAKAYPGHKLLVIFDSIGNVLSKHDAAMKMSESNQKPGGKGKSNRHGINGMVIRARRTKTAILVINYTYDNIGSPGKTNAGGKSLNLFSSLTYQTTRAGWIEKTVKGQKIRVGAKVQWKLFKNHVDKANPGPKVVELGITSEGITVLGSSDE